ncbi:MAG: ABC transporter permease subunit [Anaerolineaceae bacterium]|jgi:putative spermidine/putrescine transport system permease protein
MKQKPSVSQILIVGFFILYMIIPIVATYVFSVAVRWDRTILPEGYSLEGYTTAAKNPYFFSTLRNSLVLSLSTVLVSLIIVVPTVYWVHVRLQTAKPLLDLLMILPFGIPGVVLALALVQVYNFHPLNRSAMLLIAAEVVFTMPFMYRSVSNSINAVDIPTLTEAAQSLGAGIRNVLLEVIVPNIFPGILSGSLLVFATVFAEFTLARLIVGAGFKTFPMLLVEFTRIDGTVAAALSVISFTVAWIASLLILWAGGKGVRSTQEVVKAK